MPAAAVPQGFHTHLHPHSIALWGLAATVAMTTILSMCQGLRLTRMSLPLMLGTIVTGDWTRAGLYGFVLHLLNGGSSRSHLR